MTHLSQNFQATITAGAAEGFTRTAVSLVETGFKDIRNTQTICGLLHRAGDIQAHLLGLDHAGSGNQKKGRGIRHFKASKFHQATPVLTAAAFLTPVVS